MNLKMPPYLFLSHPLVAIQRPERGFLYAFLTGHTCRNPIMLQPFDYRMPIDLEGLRYCLLCHFLLVVHYFQQRGFDTLELHISPPFVL